MSDVTNNNFCGTYWFYCLGDLEIELERSVMERVDLQDSLEKMDAAVQQLEQEKKQLSADMKKVNANNVKKT